MNLENQKKQADEFLPFISTFNQNNPPVCNAIKNSIQVLKRNNIPDSKPPNFLTVSDKNLTYETAD